MRFIIVLLISVFCICCFAVDYSRGVNVKDFGARGDGIADDTIAIQKALNFIGTNSHKIMLARYPMLAGAPELGNLPLLGSTSENVRVPELLFPAGNYRISETLVGGSYLYLRGEKDSVITQISPDKDILYMNWGFRIQVRDLTFSGGRRQVVLWTGNEDTTNVTFENCRFENSSDAAFFSHNYLNPQRKDFATTTYGAYSVQWDGEKPILIPNNENEKYFANSTLFTFLNCDFINCRQVFHYNGDGSVIENCRIRMPAGADPIAMYLGGPVQIINLQATATESPAGGSWIRGKGIIMVENSVFAVEKGDGISLFSIDQPEREETLCNLMIRNTRFFSRKAPLIYCMNNMPNIVELINVVNTSGRSVNMMEWAQRPTPESLKASNYDISPALKMIPGSLDAFRFPYSFTFTGCEGISVANMPFFLKRAFEKPLPDKVFEKIHVSAVNVSEKDMMEKFTRKLYAIDYGVDLDPKTDDTASMRKVIAAASEGGPALIVLPPVLITLSEPLDIPPQIAFTASGLATLKQNDITQPIFRGKTQQLLWATNLRLASGSNGFEIQTNADDKALILIDKCLFYQQLGNALSVMADNNTNNTELALRKSVFISPVHGVVTNAKQSEIHDFWVSTNGRMSESAFITNLSGDMRITDMLGVPMPMSDHKYNHLPYVKDWPYAKDNRWFDNYGRLYAGGCRFGGEYYGISLVFNFTKTGTLAIDSGMTCFSHPGMRQCMVYLIENPATALIQNVGWVLQWPGAATAKRPESNSIKPEIYVRNLLFEKDSFRAK